MTSEGTVPSQFGKPPFMKWLRTLSIEISTQIQCIETGKALLIPRTLVQFSILYSRKQFLVVIGSQNFQWQK